MNKKQEALRRGLRSFIEDTSRELADLEGRPLRPPGDLQAEDGATSGADKIDSPRRDVQAGTTAASETPAEPARAGAGPDARSISDPPKASHAPAFPAPRTKEPVTESPQAPPAAQRHTPPVAHRYAPAVAQRDAPPVAQRDAPPVAATEPAARRYGAAPAAPSHAAPAAPVPAEKPKRRAPAPVRRRPRPAAEIGANGVSPAQAHARKGVCFAYFLNHECWRVADAYCNSALQVCITRECPIYHLHKDALERRFAKKFKHFW